MPSTLIRLAVALLTFGFGVSATMFWIAYRTPDVKIFAAAPRHAHPLPLVPPVPTVEELPPTLPPATLHMRAQVSAGVLDGRALLKPLPVYPALAGAGPASGNITVYIVVDETGKVIEAQAISGHPLLRQAAVRAAYQAEFTPVLVAGQPVAVFGSLTYDFVLP
jgi:TonB family protein